MLPMKNCWKKYGRRISRGDLDESVTAWILEMSPLVLCKAVLSERGFENILIRFSRVSDERATFVVDSIGNGLVEATQNSFAATDPFARIVYEIISSSAPF